MNARKRQIQEPQDRQSMKGALVKSTLFHVAIFLATVVSIPFLAKEPVVVAPVSVELVDISDMTRTNKVAPPKKEPEKPKEIEAPKPPEKKPEPPKQVAEKPPEPKPPEPKKEPPKEPEKEPEKKPEPPKEALAPPKPEKKKEPEKKPEPPKPKPPEKKQPDPKKEEEQEEDFASLLKNLTPAENTPPEPETPEKPVEDAEPAAGQIAELSDRLSISELDAFKRQIEPCWNVPAGAEYAENLAVEVRVIMRRDMTVQDASVLDQARYNRDSAFQAAADSALRALRNPRCSPLKLPPEKYNEWKTIVINFDPREML